MTRSCRTSACCTGRSTSIFNRRKHCWWNCATRRIATGFGLERVTADDLLAAGRLYRQTAEYTGHQALVRMLEDLEPVLVEVARGPDRIDDRDRQWLRHRIDDDNLLFKVRAVSNDVRGRITN